MPFTHLFLGQEDFRKGRATCQIPGSLRPPLPFTPFTVWLLPGASEDGADTPQTNHGEALSRLLLAPRSSLLGERVAGMGVRDVWPECQDRWWLYFCLLRWPCPYSGQRWRSGRREEFPVFLPHGCCSLCLSDTNLLPEPSCYIQSIQTLGF